MTEAEANYWNITEAADLYYNQYPDHPDGKEYSRWKQFWETRASQDSTLGSFADAFQNWTLLNECNNFPCGEDDYEASWISLGPNSAPANGGYVGRVQTVCTDPHDPDKKIVYAGSATSGLYRTNDIYAISPIWECLTCSTGYPVLGIMSISIDPNEPNPEEDPVIYLAVSFEMANFSNYGAGFLRSRDEGETWEMIHPIENTNFQHRTWAIAHHPEVSGMIFASVNGFLYWSQDQGDNWDLLFELYDENDHRYIRDIVFHPTEPDILYVSGDDELANDEGASFFCFGI